LSEVRYIISKQKLKKTNIGPLSAKVTNDNFSLLPAHTRLSKDN